MATEPNDEDFVCQRHGVKITNNKCSIDARCHEFTMGKVYKEIERKKPKKNNYENKEEKKEEKKEDIVYENPEDDPNFFQ